MKNTFVRLVTLSALFTASCGGDPSTPPDLSVEPLDLSVKRLDLSVKPLDLSVLPLDMSMPPPDLNEPPSDLSGCIGSIHRLASGRYPAVAGTGDIISDTCMTGLGGPAVESARQIQNDGMGNITLYASDGSTVIGAGPVRCNKGMLSSGPIVISDGICRFTAQYSVDFTVTADNAFAVLLTQSRSGTISEPGRTCTQPSTCAVNFKVSHTM